VQIITYPWALRIFMRHAHNYLTQIDRIAAAARIARQSGHQKNYPGSVTKQGRPADMAQRPGMPDAATKTGRTGWRGPCRR